MRTLFELYLERVLGTLKRVLVDYTEILQNNPDFPGLITAQGYRNQFRALLHLDKYENIKIDNDIAEYKLIIRVLKDDCENSYDRAWTDIKFEDDVYLSRPEVEQFLFLKNRISLFDYFKEY